MSDLTREEVDFIDNFSDQQEYVHQTAVEKGWWESKDAETCRDGAQLLAINNFSPGGEFGLKKLASKLEDQNDGEKIALMHSELSEALEALRHGNKPSDHIPEFSGVEEEFADVIIRIMDLSEKRGWKVAEAVIAKAAFNRTREHKHGGKKF